ncbi:hypothetical protein [Pseudomonas fluorescens]|uniref:Peptidase metallopeptidase domain-containing protein n=1 Tax=Pseudomonas fluorescens TaxID=294 RepID=A0A423KYI0_PSEFL|nr:hypothetical protein [Pseudomonas fluorescens]RON61092.1 hypothetical protein BK671_27100 [Pseudomonas fluorescens]
MWAKNNPSKFWTPGSTIKIAFINGTQEYKDATIAAASQWLPHINLKFDFVEGDQGDVRIFSYEGNFSSYIGTDALSIDADEPTMTLWPHSPIHAAYFAANVMHEFGHMLGAEHEQTHPAANIPWNKAALYEAHGNSDEIRQTVYQWYLDRADPDESLYSEYDRKSIMHYVIHQHWTEGDFENHLNLELSAKDKAFMAKAYPYPADPNT